MKLIEVKPEEYMRVRMDKEFFYRRIGSEDYRVPIKTVWIDVSIPGGTYILKEVIEIWEKA